MATKSQQELPKTGDRLRCEQCGMEVSVDSDCQSSKGPRFECCGQPMSRA